MSTIDVQRAIGVLNTAMAHNMFPQGAIPESDSDKLIAAEEIIGKCRQAEKVAEVVGKARLPTWPAVEAVLFQANVIMGTDGIPSAQPVQTQVSQPQQTVPAPVSQIPNPTPVVQPQQSKTTTKASTNNDGGLTINRAVTQAKASDPVAGEVWLDHSGNEWEVTSYSGGMSAMVKSVKTGDPTMVPSGFLKTRKSESKSEPTPVQEPETAITNALEEQQVVQALSQTTEQPVDSSVYQSPNVPDGAQPGDQVKIDGNTFNVTADGNALTGTPVAIPAQSESNHPVLEAIAEQLHQTHSDISDQSNKSESDEEDEDERYQQVIYEVDRLYTPSGMPVPHDLENPPEIMPDDLVQVDGVEARRLHSQFNALAARAKLLHDKQNALARRCELYRKLFLKAAMRHAREELGKSATVTEVQQLAEEDENVSLWANRKFDHAEEADAFKTFMEIYTQNVAVLSRDGSLRESQVRGS
jgi:hypothetical protein